MRSNPHVCLHSSTIFSISKYCDTIRNSLCCYAFSKLTGIWRETLAMIQQYYKITTSIVHHSQLSNIFFFHYFRPVHQLVSRSFSFRHDSAFLHCIIIPRWPVGLKKFRKLPKLILHPKNSKNCFMCNVAKVFKISKHFCSILQICHFQHGSTDPP